jgi:multiple sugar transport system substrate-binding protein
MAQWQNPDESAEAGNFTMIPMPGETGETLGFVRFYGLTTQVPERGDEVREAAASFLRHFGGPGDDGDWPVVKEWVRRWGLGFGYQSLFEDPEVRELFGEWTDVDVLEEISRNARARKLSEWYPQWDVFTRGELQRAYLGQISTEEAVQSIAGQWDELRG